jgi:hypothetical protein
MSSSVHLRPKLNLVDVEYLRNNVELLFDTPSPPSGPQGKTVSPKKKNAKLKESKGSTKKKKKGGKGKGGKKKKKGELEAERAGKLQQQKKDMYKNYLLACGKIQIPPLKRIVNLFSMQESVDWTQEERDMMNAPVTFIGIENERIGPGGARAICCALTGRWVAGSNETFGPAYGILEALTFKRGEVGPTGAESIAAMLELRSCTIAALHLYACGIQEAGLASLARSLRYGYNNSLVELRLDGDETVGDDGVEALSRGLETNSKLKSLCLGSCGLGPRSGLALGRLLKCRRCQLEHLGLETNKFGGDGLRLLCMGLVRLKVKDKVGNRIEDVDRFCPLKSLDIASIDIDAKKATGYGGIEMLGRVLLENPNIRSIDFNLNMLDQYAGSLLHSALSTAKYRGSSALKNFIVSTELPGNIFQDLYMDETTPRKFEEVPLATIFDRAVNADKDTVEFRTPVKSNHSNKGLPTLKK